MRLIPSIDVLIKDNSITDFKIIDEGCTFKPRYNKHTTYIITAYLSLIRVNGFKDIQLLSDKVDRLMTIERLLIIEKTKQAYSDNRQVYRRIANV